MHIITYLEKLKKRNILQLTVLLLDCLL